MAEDKLDIKSKIDVSITKPQVASVESQVPTAPDTKPVLQITSQAPSVTSQAPSVTSQAPRIHKLTPVQAKTRVLRFANGDVIEVPGNQRDIAHDSDLLS